jgi:hypothetical protein
MIVSQFMPHDAAQYISHSHTGSFRVVVGLQIAPVLRIGAKEDAQAQHPTGVNKGNFAGRAAYLIMQAFYACIGFHLSLALPRECETP